MSVSSYINLSLSLWERKLKIQCWCHHQTWNLQKSLPPSLLKKYEKIRKQSRSTPSVYSYWYDQCLVLLETFIELSESDVHKLIMKLQMKSCELDPIPPHILKGNLDSFLLVLTKLVNVSLMEGVYCDEWKVAIPKPLLIKN